VLFFGNSYTYTNDLPSVLRHLAASGGKQIQTGQRTPAGETLSGHARAAETQQLLHDGTWNVVVLQDQSQTPASAWYRTTEMNPAARQLVPEARAVHAMPLFFLTPARSFGWPEQGLPTYEQMQSAIDTGYLSIGHALAAPVAPVGVAWEKTLRSAPRLKLWAADGSHPSPLGTYLAACVFYAAIFRTTPEGLSYHEGLTTADARRLQGLAATVVLDDPAAWGL
jgi:hypothetical protein